MAVSFDDLVPGFDDLIPQQPAAPKPGVMAGVSRALEANLPFVDRAVAGAQSILPQGYGGTGQDYSSNLATERTKNEQFAEQNPWTNAVGGLAAYAPAALLPGGSGLASRIGTGALTGFGLGGLQGASNSPDLTNTEETGRDIAQGELTGGAFGAFAPAAAHGIGTAYNAVANALRGGPGPADLAALGAAKDAAYQHVKDLGAAYSPQSFKSLTDKIASDASDADLDPDLNPKAAKIIANLQNRSAEAVKSGTPVTLTDLDKARQFVNDNLSGLPEPKQARFGGLIKNNIDDFVNTAFPGDMVPMSVAKAAGAPMPSGLQVPPEQIVSAAVKAPNGDVFTAPNHPLALEKAESAGHDIWDMVLGKANDQGVRVPPPDSGGFVTSSGRYVSRDEASKMTGTKGNQLTGELEKTGPVASERPQVPPGPAPTPMLDFLRRAGGLKDEGGDLASMGFSNLQGVAGKGSSKIIDKENGIPMDEGRRMAVESGYMEPHETVADFINKLGDHPTYSQSDEEAVAARAARNAYDYGPDQDEGQQAAISGKVPFELGEQENVAPSRTANPQEAADAIRNARDLAQRQFKANALASALGKAQDRAAVSGTGGNIENTTRQKLLAIRDNEPWSQDELAQLNKVIRGTPETNTLRDLSRFGPKGNALMAALEVAAVGSGHPLLAVAGAGGMAAQGLGALARRNAQNKLMSTILAGGNAPVRAAPSPRLSRAAMAAALAGNADLQAPRNQATPQ